MPADINAEMTPEMLALGREARRIIKGDAMPQIFESLKKSYVYAWENSQGDEEGARLRGTLWVKMQCLADLQTELNSYAERAEFAESEG